MNLQELICIMSILQTNSFGIVGLHFGTDKKSLPCTLAPTFTFQVRSG